MDLWIVANGEPYALNDATEDADGVRLIGQDGRRLWRADYGVEWLVVQADGADDAIAQADAFDADRHPAQTEMALFAAAYRAGAFALMQTGDVSA